MQRIPRNLLNNNVYHKARESKENNLSYNIKLRIDEIKKRIGKQAIGETASLTED